MEFDHVMTVMDIEICSVSIIFPGQDCRMAVDSPSLIHP